MSNSLMTPRWLAVLLSLFLAAPLCCCGWHRVAVGQDVASCPMCEAADSSHRSESDDCACARELIQRDVAPRAVLPTEPGGSFACLPETLTGRVMAHRASWQRNFRFYVAERNTGPPRWYLKHRALLC